jgi:5-methyltetrahydrofolate--homocysteine methyltransferase
MQIKTDLKEAKERLAAFWEGTSLDRPVISYKYERNNLKIEPTFDPWFLAKNWDDINNYIISFEKYAECHVYGGEYIPTLHMNYGPGIMAAIFGCVPKFLGKTMWFHHPTPINEVVDLLESAVLNDNNKWYHRLIHFTEKAADSASKHGYMVDVTDLGGILDILASFVDPMKIIVGMKQSPGIIDTCRQIIMDKWHRLYSDLTAILDRYQLGCIGWLNIWSPKHWYPIQCDFSAMLSPKWFQRFVLPDLKEQCDRLDYCVYHWDGPRQLQFKDDLLRIPNLSGLQWCPGVNQPETGADAWVPLYKEIQAANKFIVAETDPPFLAKMYRDLNPKKLFTITNLGTELMSEFYLPKFLGGMDGIDTE